MSHTLRFRMADGGFREIAVRYALNAGYAGRDTEQVQHHVDELAALGVPAPKQIPTLYPISANLVTQAGAVQVPHGKTSGEAEWALLVGDDVDDLLLTVASDHTDRDLEVHGVAWSKQSAPNILGDVAWSLADTADVFDDFSLRAWVSNDGGEQLIQDGIVGQLLPPSYWVEKLAENKLLLPGTVLLSGTVPMVPGVRQFAEAWHVEMTDPIGRTSRIEYWLEQLPPPWD